MNVHKIKNKNKEISIERTISKDIKEIQILKEIISSEPAGKRLSQLSFIKKANRKSKDKVRQQIGRFCRKLEDKGYIRKENKQEKYHVTEKIYGYPKQSGFLFGSEAIKSINLGNDDINNWISATSKFCNNKLYKNILDKKSLFLSSNNNDDNNTQLPVGTSLFEFALKLSATIIYILIQAIRPKIFYLDRKNEPIELNTLPIKGKDKDKMSLDWVTKAINPEMILLEFCRLALVERGLALYTKIPISPTFPLEVKDRLSTDKKLKDDPNNSIKLQKQFLEKQEKVREFDPGNSYWSSFEMDEENHRNLIDVYEKVFPNYFGKLEEIRKKTLMV